LTYEIC